MRKGQGASKRKTLLEAKFGPAASGAAGKHIALYEEYKGALVMLEIVKDHLAAKEPYVTEAHVETRRQYVFDLKERIFESWNKVIHQPETLLNLAIIAKQTRTTVEQSKTYIEGANYPVEWAVLTMYSTGHKDYRVYQKLLAYAEEIDPEITEATFSKIVKRYGLVLKREKSGPKPERRHRQ